MARGKSPNARGERRWTAARLVWVARVFGLARPAKTGVLPSLHMWGIASNSRTSSAKCFEDGAKEAPRTTRPRMASRIGRIQPLRPLLAGTCAVLLLGLSGCQEVKGRRLIQQGNALYRDGAYAEAVKKFEAAEEFVPNLPTLWLNKGYTCKRMIIPGAKNVESFKAANCAIKAFQKLKELKPDDPRGDMLYTQTLFDADRYKQIAEIYEERFRGDPKDRRTVSVLMQVYTKWDAQTFAEGGKLNEALEWYRTNVSQAPDDPETYYALGTFIYNQLAMKGGGPDKQKFDPRPGAANEEQPFEPVPSDIVGQQRLDLADEGLQYLEKAVALRPTYTDAMAYLNLLYRQRAFAFFPEAYGGLADPDQWYESVLKAEEWKDKTLALLRARAAGDKPKAGDTDPEAASDSSPGQTGADGKKSATKPKATAAEPKQTRKKNAAAKKKSSAKSSKKASKKAAKKAGKKKASKKKGAPKKAAPKAKKKPANDAWSLPPARKKQVRK